MFDYLPVDHPLRKINQKIEKELQLPVSSNQPSKESFYDDLSFRDTTQELTALYHLANGDFEAVDQLREDYFQSLSTTGSSSLDISIENERSKKFLLQHQRKQITEDILQYNDSINGDGSFDDMDLDLDNELDGYARYVPKKLEPNRDEFRELLQEVSQQPIINGKLASSPLSVLEESLFPNVDVIDDVFTSQVSFIQGLCK